MLKQPQQEGQTYEHSPFSVTGQDSHKPLLVLLEKLAKAEGTTETIIPGLKVFRMSAPTEPFAVEYNPSICVVAQGRKQVVVGNHQLEYNPVQYLVASLPVPVVAKIIEASEKKPLLGIAISIDILKVGQLLLSMPKSTAPPSDSTVLRVSPMEPVLYNAVFRLLQAACDEVEAKVLGAGILHEVMFRVLSGAQGDMLRALTVRDGPAQRVAQAVQYVQEHYHRPLDVVTIAKSVCVSSSTLHHNFKEVMALSPIQYLKQVRLHRARLLLVVDGLNVGEAAYQVGYNSLSQFSREFKRMFGLLPSRMAGELS